MSKIICICSTDRDIRELQNLPVARGHEFILHHYASLELEDLTANEPPDGIRIADPEMQICALLNVCAKENVGAAISTDDYPGSILTSIISDKKKFFGTKPRANLVCQHKFYSRQVQAAAVPEAVPDFHLIDVRPAAAPSDVRFPLFIKPVKYTRRRQVLPGRASTFIANSYLMEADKSCPCVELLPTILSKCAARAV